MTAAKEREMERDVELAYERSNLGPARINDEMLARLLVRATRNSLKYTMEQALAEIQKERHRHAEHRTKTTVSRWQPHPKKGSENRPRGRAGVSERTHAARDGAPKRAAG
jgi:hypothetical protein